MRNKVILKELKVIIAEALHKQFATNAKKIKQENYLEEETDEPLYE